MPAPLSSLRLLILSPPPRLPHSPSPFPSLLHALTGTPATQGQAASGFAGYTSHPPLQLRTKYYDADVGIWCDEVPLPLPPSLQASTHRSEPETSRRAPDFGESGIATTSTGTTTTSHQQLDEREEAHHPHELSNSTRVATAGYIPTATEAADISSHNAPTESEGTPPSLSAWRATMLSSPAQEVRQAIGGIILVLPLPLPLPSTTLDSVSASAQKQHPSDSDSYLDVIEAVAAVRDLIEDERPGRDVPAVVLVTATSPGKADVEATSDQLEELVQEERGILGWEFVAWDGEVTATVADKATRVRNEYGELVGLERVRELLEAVDWSAETDDVEWSAPGKPQRLDLDLGFFSGDDDDEDGAGDFGPTDPIKLQGQELEREMMGLKLAMMRREHDNDSDDDTEGAEDADGHDRTARSHVVDEGDEKYEDEDDDENQDEDLKIDALPTLLERVVAIRDAGAEMSQAEREKFARREIESIMKELT